MAEDKKKSEGGFTSPPVEPRGTWTASKDKLIPEKVIQITLALNGVMALTNKGRMFMFSDKNKWAICQPIDFNSFK